MLLVAVRIVAETPPLFSGSLEFDSRGVFYGIINTINNPKVAAELDFNKHDFYATLEGTNIDVFQDSLPTSYVSGGTLGLYFSVGFKKEWTPTWNDDMGATLYTFPGVPRQSVPVPPLPLVRTLSGNALELYDTITYKGWLYFSFYATPIEPYFGAMDARGSGSVEIGADIPVGRWLPVLSKGTLHLNTAWSYNCGTDPRNIAFNSNYVPGAPYDHTPSNGELGNYGNYLVGFSYELARAFTVGFNYNNTYNANILLFGSQDQCVTPGFCGPNLINLAAPTVVVYFIKKF